MRRKIYPCCLFPRRGLPISALPLSIFITPTEETPQTQRTRNQRISLSINMSTLDHPRSPGPFACSKMKSFLLWKYSLFALAAKDHSCLCKRQNSHLVLERELAREPDARTTECKAMEYKGVRIGIELHMPPSSSRAGRLVSSMWNLNEGVCRWIV